MTMTREEQISDAAQMCGITASRHDLDCFAAGAEFADTHPNWHDTDDMLPEPEKPVLCYTDKGTYVVAWQTEKLIGGKPSGKYHWSRWNVPIAAWIELPRPPKFD